MSNQKILEEIRELKARIATLEHIIAPPENPFDIFDIPAPTISRAIKNKKRPIIAPEYVWEEKHITTENKPIVYIFKVASGKYYANDKDIDTMTCKDIMNSKAMLNKLTMPTNSSALTKAIAIEYVKNLMDKKCITLAHL